MATYEDLAELARICAKNARTSVDQQVAETHWQLAVDFQARAAELGEQPEIGPLPDFLNGKKRRGNPTMDVTGFEAPCVTPTAQIIDDKVCLEFLRSKIAEVYASVQRSRDLVTASRLGISHLDLMLHQMGHSVDQPSLRFSGEYPNVPEQIL